MYIRYNFQNKFTFFPSRLFNLHSIVSFTVTHLLRVERISLFQDSCTSTVGWDVDTHPPETTSHTIHDTGVTPSPPEWKRRTSDSDSVTFTSVLLFPITFLTHTKTKTTEEGVGGMFFSRSIHFLYFLRQKDLSFSKRSSSRSFVVDFVLR